MPGNPLIDINNLSDVSDIALARENLDVDSKEEGQQRVEQLKSDLATPEGTKLLSLSIGTVFDALKALTPEMYIDSGLFTNVTSALNQMVIDAANNGIPINANTGTYTLTSGQTLLIQGVEWYGGTLVGTGATAVQIKNVYSERLSFNKCGVRHIGGDFIARKIRAENSTATAAILISNLDSSGIVDLDGVTLVNNNYGILGQGAAGSAVTRLSLNHLYASGHKGDPIELNLVQSWGRIEIRNIVIDSVTGSGKALDYWGIGIGISGAGNYALQTPDADMASNIFIENVVVSGCRQPIHLEKCRDFTLRSLQLYPDDTVNTIAGLIPTGVSIVGCREFTIEQFSVTPVNIATTPAITTSWGVISGGVYSGPCRNFTIRNGETTGRLSVYTGSTSSIGSEVDISNVKALGPGSFIKGYPSKLRVKGLRANALLIDFAHTTGEGIGALTRNSAITCVLDTITSEDDNGVPNGTAQHIYADLLDVRGCNFPVAKAATATGGRGALIQPSKALTAPGLVFPVGVPFFAGDRIFRSSADPAVAATGWLVTTSGVLIAANDAVKAAVASQTYIEANTNGLDWASLNPKCGGIQIVIPGGGVEGADLTTTITRAPFVSGGFYRVTIDPPLATDIPAGTVIRAAVPIAYQEIAAFANVTAAAVPTTGAHLVGDRVWNTVPAAGGYMGWVCITAGTPGTWKGFGMIES